MHNNGKDNLGKFDARSDEWLFVGYYNHSKAYRICNKRNKLIEESVHVIFGENQEGITITTTFDEFKLKRAEYDDEEDNEPLIKPQT